MLVCLLASLMILEAALAPLSKNHELLKKLGMTKVKHPNSHHRKRLAVESRHHTRSDDSHMFIIKLPPNPHYYGENRPNSVEEGVISQKNYQIGFQNNGKPAKVYHWNIPTINKMFADNNLQRSNNHNVIAPLFYNNADDYWGNEVLDKPSDETKKHLKTSYYVPEKPKKGLMKKYFAGNGKPHSFYVIDKSKAAHFHTLLPS